MSANEEWTRHAQLYVAALAATGSQFTVDEVHDMLALHCPVTHSDGKAMGAVMQHLSKRLGVIAPIHAWQTSVRAPDRPIRMFVGTGVACEHFDVTEEIVVRALQSIERVNQARSQLMVEQLRRVRQVTA